MRLMIISFDSHHRASTTAPDEGRDECHSSLGTGDSLSKRKEKGKVAVEALLLELFSRTNALPSGGNLEKDTLFDVYTLMEMRRESKSWIERV